MRCTAVQKPDRICLEASRSGSFLFIVNFVPRIQHNSCDRKGMERAGSDADNANSQGHIAITGPIRVFLGLEGKAGSVHFLGPAAANELDPRAGGEREGALGRSDRHRNGLRSARRPGTRSCGRARTAGPGPACRPAGPGDRRPRGAGKGLGEPRLGPVGSSLAGPGIRIAGARGSGSWADRIHGPQRKRSSSLSFAEDP